MNIKKAIPFLDDKSVNEIVDLLLEKEQFELVSDMAYALSNEDVEKLFSLYVEKGIEVNGLLPFVSSEFLKNKVMEEINKL